MLHSIQSGNAVRASQLLVYRMPASRAQVQVACGVALALFLVFVATQYFREVQLRPLHAAVLITSVILVMADWITATLLFAQARILRARPLRLLALGFFIAGLFVVFRLMANPGAGFSEKHYNLPLWFYLASHAALPLAILAYAWPRPAASEPSLSAPPGRQLTDLKIFVSAAWAPALVIMLGETSLPWTSPILLTALAVLLPTIIAMDLLWRRLASVLDLWLMLMLWGWLLEITLIALPAPGYTAGWYAARGLGLVSGLFVLFALLAETSKLYAQTMLQLIAQTQEREHRFLIRDVMSATIAHDLRQPLAAILINAEVAHRIACDKEREQASKLNEIMPVLDDIIASSVRANDMLESTRSMFGRAVNDRDAVDVTEILQSTLAMVENSARAHGVSVKFVMEGEPGPVVINRLQLRQALLNLFQNAIEALSRSEAPDRTLLVRCSSQGDRGVIVRVEDNGPGIAPADQKKIFDRFFTTRTEGLGMGLVIARSVIRSHGGRLEVEPRSLPGTAFTIHLPSVNRRPESARPRRSTVSGDARFNFWRKAGTNHATTNLV
jgi:signal transduction histidine kinase